ncbi:MAG: DUF4349 domain-containing protein [Oscillospiraceae bacterium]|nr:DUF4349 domain-containing protein [Oscillospiraceae bacterium]
MNRMKKISAYLLTAVLLTLLCGCSSAKSGQRSMPTPRPMFSADYTMEEAAYSGEYGFSATAAASSATGSASSGNQEKAPETDPEKIIYSADVTVETTDFEKTVGKVDELVKTYGAWVESSSVSGSDYYQTARGETSARSASYTLRVPADRFQAMMDHFTQLGNIPYSHIYTENVTSQYFDTQARLNAYKTQEARLLEMMEIAESVEDVIIIEDRLTELRYKIESLQTSLNNWDRRVSYSTVYLNVKEVRVYTPEEKIDPSYGEELAAALKDGFYNAGQFLKNVLVFLVEILPVLIVLVPLIWLFVWLIRKLVRYIRKTRKNKKASKASKKQEPSEAQEETEEKPGRDGKEENK